MPGVKESAPDQDEDCRVLGAIAPPPDSDIQGQQAVDAAGHVHDGEAQAQPLRPEAAAAPVPGIEDEEDDYDDL